MGACEDTNVLETEHKPTQIDIANTVTKSICKISIKMKDQNIKNGIGFFMNISNSSKYLITNYHVINPDLINEGAAIFGNQCIVVAIDARRETDVAHIVRDDDVGANACGARCRCEVVKANIVGAKYC